MGAWGVGFNECDGALDFLGDIGDSRNWALIEQQLKQFIDEDGYEGGEEAYAALELIAAALGQASPRLEPELATWAGQHSEAALSLKDLSIQSVELLAEKSELRELWEEAEDDFDEWLAGVIDLKNRLNS
jgi:Domain of unknown function (DUF4259)